MEKWLFSFVRGIDKDGTPEISRSSAAVLDFHPYR